jgi:TetR/AcrR family transcriptional regulator, transcriptional repressor for nem operon
MANSRSPTGGRPLGFEPAQALDRVVETFWVNGYDATTTTLLEQATGLSRSSLLNTFGPKEQLLLAAVDRYQSMMDDELLDPMLNGERGLADLDRFFTALGAMKNRAPGSSGCLVVNLGSLAELTPGLRERVDRYHERLEAATSAALTRAVDRGEMDRRLHATRLSVMVGMAIAVNWMARAQGPEAARMLVTAARRQLSRWAAGRP